jgi:hypothetical protein
MLESDSSSKNFSFLVNIVDRELKFHCWNHCMAAISRHTKDSRPVEGKLPLLVAVLIPPQEVGLS